MFASLKGFAPMSEIVNAEPMEIGRNYLRDQLGIDRDQDYRQIGGRNNDYYRIEVEERHGASQVYKRMLKGGGRMHWWVFNHTLTGKQIVVPTLSRFAEFPFSLRYADQVTLDKGLDLIRKVNSWGDYERERASFEQEMGGSTAVEHIDRSRLEEILRAFAPEDSIRDFLPQVERHLGPLEDASSDLDLWSMDSARRIFLKDSSVVIKRISNEDRATREFSCLNEAQHDDYLGSYLPALAIPKLFSYGRSYFFVMKDLSEKIVEIPEYTLKHFAKINEMNTDVQLDIYDRGDFKLYLAGLLHWRGRLLKDSLPQHLFTMSYMPFQKVEDRFVEGRLPGHDLRVSELLSAHNDGIDVLEGLPATTVLGGDMQPDNFVYTPGTGNGHIPVRMVDFGKAALGPGSLDTVRLVDYARFSGSSVEEFDASMVEQMKKYFAITHYLNHGTALQMDLFEREMKIFRTSVIVDGSRMGSWLVGSGKVQQPGKRQVVDTVLRMGAEYAKEPGNYLWT
jgi:hypothetical protein